MHENGFKDNGKECYLRMMSQALSYAMHTRNGCVVLTNHNWAMFLKVEPYNSDGIWKLRVKVSRQYKCNGTHSSYHGIIAILRKERQWCRQHKRFAARFQRHATSSEARDAS